MAEYEECILLLVLGLPAMSLHENFLLSCSVYKDTIRPQPWRRQFVQTHRKIYGDYTASFSIKQYLFSPMFWKRQNSKFKYLLVSSSLRLSPKFLLVPLHHFRNLYLSYHRPSLCSSSIRSVLYDWHTYTVMKSKIQISETAIRQQFISYRTL